MNNRAPVTIKKNSRHASQPGRASTPRLQAKGKLRADLLLPCGARLPSHPSPSNQTATRLRTKRNLRRRDVSSSPFDHNRERRTARTRPAVRLPSCCVRVIRTNPSVPTVGVVDDGGRPDGKRHPRAGHRICAANDLAFCDEGDGATRNDEDDSARPVDRTPPSRGHANILSKS
jgi:hypothetical protein